MFVKAQECADANKALILWDSAALYCQKKHYWEQYVVACSGAAFQSTTLVQPKLCYENTLRFEQAFNNYSSYLRNNKDSIKQNVILAYSFYYFKIGDHKKVISLIETHLTNLKSKGLDRNENYVHLIINDYINIGANELILGNIPNAIENYTEVYKILQLYFPKNFRRNLQLNINLGSLYTKINNFNQASIYYQKALIAKDSLVRKMVFKNNNKLALEEINQNYILLYRSIADFHLKQFKYDSAIFALNTALTYLNQDNPIWQSIMKKLGDVYIEASMFDKAQVHLQKALVAAQKKYTRHFELARINLSFARLSDKKKEYAKALIYTQQALIALSEKFDNPDIATTPSVLEVFSKRDLLEVLDLKVALLLKMAATQPNYLDIAYTTSQNAEGLIDIIRADCTSDFDKQYLADLCYPIYEKSVRIAYQLYARDRTDNYMVSVYNSIEKNKASVLLEALKNTQAETEINQTDRNRLYQLRSEISKLEDKIYREKNEKRKTLDNSDVMALQSRLTEAKREFEAFTKKLESQTPDYYRLKFGKLTRDMVDIQKELPLDAILLDYFITPDAIYSIALTHNSKPMLFKTDKGSAFDSTLLNLRRFISEQRSMDASLFAKQSYALYDALLHTPLSTKGIGIPALATTPKPNRLIIIPDGLLNYIPFDILLTANSPTTPSFAQMPYVLRDFTVSYAYSAAAYVEQKRFKTGRAKKLFAGFAPIYKTDSTQNQDPLAFRTRSNPLRNLPGAQREVDSAAVLFKGDAFRAADATEKAFRDHAHEYRVLHLGMHSLLNDKFSLLSHLVFTNNSQDSTLDNELTINELYGLRLQADLAVLSACNTGVGDINRGEGVISVSRAFAYAGVPATIMSLWEVEDFSTSKIIAALYKNLKAGQYKDEALRAAKLHYLDNAKTETEAHPYFWAGLITTGNNAPLDCSTPLSVYWLLLLSPFAYIIYLYTKNKVKNQTSPS